MMMVKGSVKNGVVKVIAVVDGRVVGYQKPVQSNQPAVKVEPVVQQETLDVPDFMKERTKEMQKQKRMKRIFKTI